MITVIGSMSLDFVVETKRVPDRGETIMGESFETFFGGKGSNQAVGIAKLGHEVAMIGCVGDDTFGQQIIDNMASYGVDVEGVRIAEDTSSGSAHIFIEDGDNRIVVVAASNNLLSPADIDQHIEKIKKSDLVLIQYEIPTEVIDYVAEVCETLEVPLAINPAPMKQVSDQTIERATYLKPNEVEVKQLFPGKTVDEVLLQYPRKLIVTEGADGVVFANDAIVRVPAHKTKVVDTTGAGDAFNAGFCVGIAEKMGLVDAVSFGNLVASHGIRKKGAQSGLPLREEL